MQAEYGGSTFFCLRSLGQPAEAQSGTPAEGDECELSDDDHGSLVRDVPEQTYPSLDEYRLQWGRDLEKHSKPVPGEFGSDNLIPTPQPEFWQDAPHVPFDQLRSKEAQARLALCWPTGEVS